MWSGWADTESGRLLRGSHTHKHTSAGETSRLLHFSEDKHKHPATNGASLLLAGDYWLPLKQSWQQRNEPGHLRPSSGRVMTRMSHTWDTSLTAWWAETELMCVCVCVCLSFVWAHMWRNVCSVCVCKQSVHSSKRQGWTNTTTAANGFKRGWLFRFYWNHSFIFYFCFKDMKESSTCMVEQLITWELNKIHALINRLQDIWRCIF